MSVSGQNSDTNDTNSEFIFFKENFFKEIEWIYPMCVIDESKSNSDEVVLRLPLETCEEAEELKSNLSKITSSNWIVYRNHKTCQRVVFSKSWLCQLAKKNKSPSGLRNADCGAKLSVLIKKVNRNTIKNDPYLKNNPPLNAEIKLSLKHTHTLFSAAVLKLLRVDESVKEKFYEYFSLGMTPTEASRCHETRFFDDGGLENLANASIYPTKRQVNHLYDNWRLANLCPGINPFDNLIEKMPLYCSSEMEFSQQKKLCLQKIDLSKKGTIDKRIIELVDTINEKECYITTSSCSGRTIVFTNSELKKKGCNWLFVSHDIVSNQSVTEALDSHSGSAILKFEPFVMHVRCSSIEDAQKLHTCCVESGFRNSGFTVNRKGGIVLAVRSTLSLEVPLSCDGKLLVSPEYISYVVNICNEKMTENWIRTEKFLSHVKAATNQVEETVSKKRTKISSQQNRHFSDNVKELKIKDSKEYCYDILDSFCDSFEIMTSSENMDS